MTFSLADFFIGFFLMNAMPHLLFGLYRIRFISLFGLSPMGNLAYALFNIGAALTLFHINYGLSTLSQFGLILGAGFVWVMYVITGNFFYNLVNTN